MPQRFCLLLGIVACWFGCGLSTYEERLKATEELYSYLHEQNLNLAPAWQRRDLGISLRVPLPLRITPPPPPAAEGTGEAAAVPDFQLPGVLDTWQALFPNGQGASDEVRLLVISNQERFLLKEEGALPSSFLSEVEQLLSIQFGITIPDGESANPADNIRYRLIAPPRGSPHSAYTTSKDFTVVRFVPVGQPRQAWLFERRVGDVQAAIVVYCPQNVSPQFRQRMNLALETFAITGQVPKGTPSTPGSRSRPASGGTSGF